jgi:hypothetical protein
MHGFVLWLGRIGGSLVSDLLALVMLLGATAAGFYAEHITKRKWIGWIIALIVFVMFALLFGPALDALKRVSCHGVSDYRACIDDDDDN